MKNIIIVGDSGCGSFAAKTALIEPAVEQGYQIVIESDQASKESIFAPEPKVLTITRNIIQDLPEEIYPEADYHPFSKFIGKQKWKR